MDKVQNPVESVDAVALIGIVNDKNSLIGTTTWLIATPPTSKQSMGLGH